ncbi:phage head closure protein [Brevibacillus brevis]|uniref:phage head closure protein n=1 Tax=Brevibacillus brevis TaxID=1393 RepID=UPI0037CC58E7
MTWDELVELITVLQSNGATASVSETTRSVYANQKSVSRTEFYQAIANNLKPTVVFEVHSFEYENEQKLRHNGKEYLILRTYSKGDELIELVCQAYDDVQTNLARLRDTIEIWKNTFVENSMYELIPKPELLYTLPAQVEFKGGAERNVSNTIETSNNASVTIQYRLGITADMFVKIEGQRYDIRFIEDPFNRHETLVLQLERVIP